MEYDLDFYRSCASFVKRSFYDGLRIRLYETALIYKRLLMKNMFFLTLFIADYINGVPTCCPLDLTEFSLW